MKTYIVIIKHQEGDYKLEVKAADPMHAIGHTMTTFNRFTKNRQYKNLEISCEETK